MISCLIYQDLLLKINHEITKEFKVFKFQQNLRIQIRNRITHGLTQKKILFNDINIDEIREIQ